MGDRFFYRQEPKYWENDHYVTFTLMRTGRSALDMAQADLEAGVATGEQVAHEARMWCHANIGSEGLGTDWVINSTSTRIHIRDRNIAFAFKLRWG